MALTLANTATLYRGAITQVYTEATLDNSYATGGVTINATDVGLSTIKAVVVTANAGYDAVYARTDDTKGTIKVFASLTPDTSSAVSAPLESSVGRDYSNVTVTLIIWGR